MLTTELERLEKVVKDKEAAVLHWQGEAARASQMAASALENAEEAAALLQAVGHNCLLIGTTWWKIIVRVRF